MAERGANPLLRRTIRAAATSALAVGALVAPASALAAHHHKPARLSISNASVREPDGSATAKAKFTVKISRKAPRTVKASYATVNGSAGQDDFRAGSGNVKIRPGKLSVHIRVTVLGDNIHESDETFRVKLSHAKGAQMKHATGTGTIIDNDPVGGGGAPDADGDGIPDSLDACPQVPDPDGYCPKSVYAVNDGTVGPGARVRVNNLMITAIDRPDSIAWAGAQPADANWQGAKYSALKLVEAAGLPVSLTIGDRVSVAGRTATGEFDVVALDTASSGGTPVSAALAVADVRNPKYDAVLGTLSGETLTTPGAQWTLFSGVGVGKKIIGVLPAKPAGTYFTTVTGISSGAGGAGVLLPRANADIVEGVAPPRSVASVHMTDDCINSDESGVPVATVKLSGPAPAGGATVTTSSDNPAAINVANAAVAAGIDTGVITASGVASGSGITINASMPANASPLDGDGLLDVREAGVGDSPCAIGTN